MSTLTDLCRMVKKKKIIGRFVGLFQDGIKNKTKRIEPISKKLLCLRQKLNFATVLKQKLSAKVPYLGWFKIILAFVRRKQKNFKKQLENIL